MRTNFLRKPFEFTILISAFFCLFHSPDLYAIETVQAVERKVDAIAFAPTQVWLSYVKTQLQNSKLDLDQQTDNYQFSNGDGSIHFVSERVDFAAHFQTKIVASDNQTASLQLSLRLDAAQIVANNFNLEAVIQKDLGFGSATLKLDMHCDAIELNLKNANRVSAEIKSNQGQFTLNQLVWDLKSTQVETKLVGCKEVAGFDQLLKDQIQQNLEQSFVIDSLQQIINQKMNGLVQQKITATLATYIQKLKLAQTQKYQFDEKNNLWVYSNASLDQVFTPLELQIIKGSTKPALLIKKNNLESYAKDSLNDILKASPISSKTADGISRLTCSRFIQTFVWPSLKSLGKCFEMKIQSQIQTLSITNLSNLSLNVKVGSWASGEGHQVAYFESAVSARLLESSVQLNSFNGQSDPEFVRWSGRSKRISTSMIQPSLEDLIQASVAKLKDNALLKLIQKNTKLDLISPETALIEVDLAQ